MSLLVLRCSRARSAAALVIGLEVLLAAAYGQALPSLSISDVSVSENNCVSQLATFTVSITAPFGKDASVSYSTADRSAVAGINYTAVKGLLNFQRGSRASQTITVPITDVLIPGPSKTFVVILSSPVNAKLDKKQGTAIIVAPSVAKCTSCALSCDDGNVCSTSTCDKIRGCVHVNASTTAIPYCQLVSGPNGATCTAQGAWVDSDGDGFSDAAEAQKYLDINSNGVYDPGVDVPLPGADPLKPDVYLHYDYAYAADHNHAPPPGGNSIHRGCFRRPRYQPAHRPTTQRNLRKRG